jgi:hypothetical protein
VFEKGMGAMFGALIHSCMHAFSEEVKEEEVAAADGADGAAEAEAPAPVVEEKVRALLLNDA